MKPSIISMLLVASLLAASALCVGTRRAADQRREEASAVVRGTGFTADPVLSLPVAGARKGASSREADSGTLERRLRSALATANPAERQRTLLAMADDFSPDDWPAALTALVEMGMAGGGSEHQLLLSAWAERDIDAARAWAEKNQSAFRTVMQTWISQDPDAALSHLLSPERQRTTEWNLQVARVLEDLATDSLRLARVLGALSEGQRRMALEQARPKFAAGEAEAVARWLDVFDPALRGKMLEFRMEGLSRFEDKTALAHAFSEDLGPNHYRALYQGWAAADKEAASSALQAMEPGDTKKAAYHGVVIGLFEKQQIAEAVEAFRAYPEYANERLLGELLLGFNVKDAELLMSLVPEIKHPDLRQARYRELLYQWLQADPAAARKWMAENEVPEQVRRQLAEP